MRKMLVGGILALLSAVTPLTVMAQVAPLDEESRSRVVGMAQRVGATLVPGLVAATSDNGDIGDEILPDVVEDPEAPAPEVEDPAPEPTDDPVTLPELDLSSLAEYSSQGVTIQVPADWIVDTDISDSNPFIIEVPETDLFISIESDSGLDFPSWLAVALFRSQTNLLLQEFGEDAQLGESTTLLTTQDLPLVKLSFTATEGGEEIGGTLFVTAPNEDAYLLVAGGSREAWEYAGPGIDLIAQSITFDEDLIEAVYVEDEPLIFQDEDESIEVQVPSGWYVIGTGDPQFPVMVAEAEVRYVAAVGNEGVFSGGFDESILEMIPEEGELDPDLYEEMFQSILDMVADSGTPFIIDEELSSFVEREGAVTVRLVGDADLGNGLSLPVIFYVDLRRTGVGVITIFGDTESALDVEDQIQEMLQSVTGL
jgi:hypothetical protein